MTQNQPLAKIQTYKYPAPHQTQNLEQELNPKQKKQPHEDLIIRVINQGGDLVSQALASIYTPPRN